MLNWGERLSSYFWFDREGIKRGPISLIRGDEAFVHWWVHYIPLGDVLMLLESAFNHGPYTTMRMELIRMDKRAEEEVRTFLLADVLKWRERKITEMVERRILKGIGE